MIGTLLPSDLLVLDCDECLGPEGVIGFLGRTIPKAAYSSRSIYKVRWGGRDVALKVEHCMVPVGVDPRDTEQSFNQSWDEWQKWNQVQAERPDLAHYLLPTLGYGQVEVGTIDYHTGEWTEKGWVDKIEQRADWRCFSIQAWTRLTRRIYDGVPYPTPPEVANVYARAQDIARELRIGDFGAHQFFVRANGDPLIHDYAIATHPDDEED